jgi:hypothetical protein
MDSHLGRLFYSIFARLNTDLPYNSTIMSLGIYPNELKTYIHIEICT